MALLTEESANQIESEKLNHIMVFGERGKSQNPGQKKLSEQKSGEPTN